VANINNILFQFWGHRDFRPMQEEIIKASLENRDVVALLPTGGGKSLCFQIPALVKEGICIVVSPLVALMEDQVNTLQKKGIKALAIVGGISYNDLDSLLDNCIYGNFKFLYLSPERLQQDIVQQRIEQMNVNLIAIDEAHCISQWGHDFRPAYLNISILRELHPTVPFMALTASATGEVVEDIKKQSGLANARVFKSSLERKNIAYKVIFAEDKIYRLRQILIDPNETGIIYVRSRNATIEIARELKYYGYKAEAFHGGLTGKEKSTRLEKWLKEEVKIMVATNAFGMGIDKSNVRNVVHLNLPESIESYFQEAGRAGRDLEPAAATIVTNNSDLPVLKNQFIKTLPDLDFTIQVFKKLCSYFSIAYGEGQESKFDFNFSAFCNHYQLHSEKTYNTLQLLDRISIIKLTQQFRKISQIQFIISGNQLFPYLEKNQKYENVTKTILRTYGGIFENKLPIDTGMISKKSGLPENQVIEILRSLNKDKIIEFESQENDAAITFLVPREDATSIFPFSGYIKNQAKNKTDKISAMLAYVENNDICKSRQLLNYFGERDNKDCGICSVCIQPDKNLKKDAIKVIYMAIIKELEEGPVSSRDLVEKISYPEKSVLNVLRLLLEKEIVDITPSQLYKLKHT
jgi:ATP-dependent DNA helicase RecQ